MKGVTGGFFLGFLVGIASGVVLLRLRSARVEDAEALSDRLSDYIGELESRIGELEGSSARARRSG